MQAIDRPARRRRKLRQDLAAAGYKGETVALIVPTDFPNLKALSDVGADMLRKIGMTVDYQATDWGTLLVRRAKMDPVGAGGWSMFFTFSSGVDMATPASNLMMRGSGKAAWFGWPSDPRLESCGMRGSPPMACRPNGRIAGKLQQEVFEAVPFVPLGQYFQSTAYRTSVSGVLDGFATFWNVKLDA